METRYNVPFEHWDPHDPNAVLDYKIDWTDWLAEVGDTILTSTWSVEGDDFLLFIDSDNKTDTTATVWLRGGTAGKVYRVTNHITTTVGREDDRTENLRVIER